MHFNRKALTGFVVAASKLVMGVFALLLSLLSGNRGMLSSLGLLLILLGLFVAGLLSIAWMWIVKLSIPKPPQHPLHINLVPPILPQWHEKLKERLAVIREYDGAIGEYNLVRRIKQVLSNDHFIVYRLQQRSSEGVDVTIIGLKSIWVFEVKYWPGKIIWSNGRWERKNPSTKLAVY